MDRIKKLSIISLAIILLSIGMSSTAAAYYDYENLDCKWASGLHDYMKFLKYGYSRASDQLCIEIRAGRMDRDRAIRIVRDYEGKVPWKYIPDFLRYLDITEKEFFDNLDRWTNRKIFITDDKGQLIKDKDGNLMKKDYGYDLKEDLALKEKES